MTTPTSHFDLLGVARAVQQAAVEEDLDALHVELSRLRNTLIEHLQAEAGALTRLPDATRQILRHGQRRLLRLLDELLFATAAEDRDCSCLVRAAELRSALAHQARLEARLHHPRPHQVL